MKKMIKFEERWVESLVVVFIVLGFIISVLLRSALFSYLSLVVAGFLAGRIYYIKRYQEPLLPFILIILGFLVGYLIGSVWVSRILVVIFFVLAFETSYYLHVKKILVIFKSEPFFK